MGRAIMDAAGMDSPVYLVGMIYTAVQLPLWYLVKVGEYTAVCYLDKVIQVMLIVVLAYLYWSTKRKETDIRGEAAT